MYSGWYPPDTVYDDKEDEETRKAYLDTGLITSRLFNIKGETERGRGRRERERGLFVGWLLNVPATGLCISGTDLLRQFYVLPH